MKKYLVKDEVSGQYLRKEDSNLIHFANDIEIFYANTFDTIEEAENAIKKNEHCFAMLHIIEVISE